MTRDEWTKFLLMEGDVKLQNVAAGKYVVFWNNDYYVIKDGEVVYTSIRLDVAKRVYKA